VSRYQKGKLKTSLDFTEARNSKWQWHQLGRMQVCTSLQTDNHTGTPQAGCPSCRPKNSVKALTVTAIEISLLTKQHTYGLHRVLITACRSMRTLFVEIEMPLSVQLW